MRFFAAAFIFFGAAASYAQAPEVPHKMQFAGMTLTIRDDAKREIQKDVDALTQHPRYYQLKVERAKTYFPIIEKILEEEHVPDDFKYLVLQESALIPDAVSISNAVGFWQFKDFTAMEMGLRVDGDIDERMNLVSATHGAARYLKQNNFYFNNWIYALQSYQMGAGGVKRAVGDLQNGARHMEINSDTYWYVKKFLAHKVAFGDMGPSEAQVKIQPYQADHPKSLKEIAAEFSAEESVLREYNKWLKTDLIPVDKPYTIFIPVGKIDSDFNKLVLSSTKASKAEPLAGKKEKENEKVNGISSIRARPGETVVALADRSGISITDFLKYNDIPIDHTLEPGQLYLLGKKKNIADQPYCKVKPGDDLWAISQRYGIRLRKLTKYNKLREHATLTAGNTVWLSPARRLQELPMAVDTPTEVVQLDENETFDWYTKSPRAVEPVPQLKAPVPDLPRQDSVEHTLEFDDLSAADSTYIVRQGDTFYSIARQYSTPVSNLLALNDMTIQTPLKTGQLLKVKGDYTQKSVGSRLPTIVHEVKASDTLYSIARQYGVTIKDLMDWNNKKDLSVSVGEKLKIIQK